MPALPRPTARTLAFWAGAVLIWVLGTYLGQQDAVWPALLLAALPLVSLATMTALRPRHTVQRAVTPPVLAVGEPGTIHLQATTERTSPAGSVVAEDDPGPGLGVPHHVRLASGPGVTTTLRYTIRARRRGRHTLDGLRVRFGDGLGFWVHTARRSHPTELVVTPASIPLGPQTVSAYGATGETPTPQTAVSGPDDVLVREYQSRDDVRRIHWPSTARMGTLMVRREEAAWDPTAWVLLDGRAHVHAVDRGERPTFEWLVSAAASIGLRLIEDGYTVTLVDTDGIVHPVSSDRENAGARWLDPLVDLQVSSLDALDEAALRMAPSSGESRIVALLGLLDRETAESVAAATASRHDRLALALTEDADGAGFAEGRSLLLDHGWDVRPVTLTTDLAAVWDARKAGSR